MDLGTVFTMLAGSVQDDPITQIFVGLIVYHLFDVLIDLFRTGGKWF